MLIFRDFFDIIMDSNKIHGSSYPEGEAKNPPEKGCTS
jgi:hypothetical protein